MKSVVPQLMAHLRWLHFTKWQSMSLPSMSSRLLSSSNQVSCCKRFQLHNWIGLIKMLTSSSTSSLLSTQLVTSRSFCSLVTWRRRMCWPRLRSSSFVRLIQTTKFANYLANLASKRPKKSSSRRQPKTPMASTRRKRSSTSTQAGRCSILANLSTSSTS